MSQQPLVSVCIANYNGMAVLDACLASIGAQQGEIAVEILVHDDASDDDSVAHLRARYPHIALIESRNNVGFCVANNRMAAAARGEYLLLLNNDAELLPDALETLLAAAQRLVHPAILSLSQFDAASGALIDRGCFLDLFFNPVPNLDMARQDVAMVIGACLWVPKVLWDELGGFPEWFGSLAEDMYLCCRARLKGYPVQVPAESGYRHWQGKSFGGNRVVSKALSTTFRRRRLTERNKTFVMLLICPWFVLVALLPLHLLLLYLEGLMLLALKRDRRLWREVYGPLLPALLGEYPRIRQLRESVRQGRVEPAWHLLRYFRMVPRKLVLLFRYGVPAIR